MRLFAQVSLVFRAGFDALTRHRRWLGIVALSMAPAIGLSTAVFSFVDAVLLKPFPYLQPERLFFIWGGTTDAEGRPGISGPDLRDWQALNTAFDDIAPFLTAPATLGRDDIAQVGSAYLGTNLFSLLGVRPAKGRLLLDSDSAPGTHVAVISHALWRQRFGGDPDICGKTVIVTGQRTEIVGVMPEGFFFPDLDVHVWLPLPSDLPGWTQRGQALVHAIARARAGVTRQHAQADLDTVNRRLAAAYPDTNRNTHARVIDIRDAVVGNYADALRLLLGAVAFILAIACTNIAILLTARGIERGREYAVRSAMGASRGRLIQQLLAENCVAALFSGALGLLVAYVILVLVRKLSVTGAPGVENADINTSVLAATFCTSVIVSLASCILPALRSTRPGVMDLLKTGDQPQSGQRGRRGRSALVGIEVGVAIILLVGTALLVRSFVNLTHANWGIDAADTLTLELRLPQHMARQVSKQVQFSETVFARLEARPQVVAAGMGYGIPVKWGHYRPTFFSLGKRMVTTDWNANMWVVSPGYFATLQVPVLLGRAFVREDDEVSQKTIVVSEAFARRVWPGSNPIGQMIEMVELKRVNGKIPPQIAERMKARDATLRTDPSAWQSAEATPRVVVGVVGDVKMFGLDLDPEPSVYIDYRQQPADDRMYGSLTPKFLVRTSVDPMSLANWVKDEIRTVEPGVEFSNVASMDSLIAGSIAGRGATRLLAVVSAMFGMVSTWIAAIGVHGIMTHAVSSRSREIAVRLALGATRSDIVALFARQAALVVAAGIVSGSAVAIVGARVVAQFLYGVTATDPAVLAGASVVMLAAAAVACVVPLWRATRVDPLALLRRE